MTSPIAKTIQDTKDAQKIAEEKRTLALPGDYSLLELSEDDLYGGPESRFENLSTEGLFGFNESSPDLTEDYLALTMHGRGEGETAYQRLPCQ